MKILNWELLLFFMLIITEYVIFMENTSKFYGNNDVKMFDNLFL